MDKDAIIKEYNKQRAKHAAAAYRASFKSEAAYREHMRELQKKMIQKRNEKIL